jgi:hypothetical protein
MPESQLVRVKLPSGREATVGASLAEKHGLQVLDKPATDASGVARPAKPRISIAEAVENQKHESEGSASASSEEETK